MRFDPDPSASLHGSFVLVVEDELLIAMDIEAMLEQHGARVLGPVPTVLDALHLLESDRPDVALLDVNLRGELVTPVADALLSLGVPFVVSSAHGSGQLDGIQSLAKAPKVGKPARERQLILALREALQVRHAM